MPSTVVAWPEAAAKEEKKGFSHEIQTLGDECGGGLYRTATEATDDIVKQSHPIWPGVAVAATAGARET